MLWKRSLASRWEAKWPFFHPSFPFLSRGSIYLRVKGAVKSAGYHIATNIFCVVCSTRTCTMILTKILSSFQVSSPPSDTFQFPETQTSTDGQMLCGSSAALEGEGYLSLSQLHGKDKSDNITSKNGDGLRFGSFQCDWWFLEIGGLGKSCSNFKVWMSQNWWWRHWKDLFTT